MLFGDWWSIGGRAARGQVSAIVPVVTHLPSRNTRDCSGMIRKHFHADKGLLQDPRE
jgi:hypothetical protein